MSLEHNSGGDAQFGARIAQATLFHPAFWIGAGAWALLNAAAIVLSGGVLPFDRPALAGVPFAAQMAVPTFGLLQIFLLMGVVAFLTHKRTIPDMAARAPERRRALRETGAVLAYA